MSPPHAFTISSEALARFPPSVQQTIVDVVQSELEKARSGCLQTLAATSYAPPVAGLGAQASMDEAWQREATTFVRTMETFLSSCSNAKRGPNFKPVSLDGDGCVLC